VAELARKEKRSSSGTGLTLSLSCDAMAKKRVGDPWMPASEYGRALPLFSVNLVVKDIERSVRFYREVLGVEVRYSDPDFAALKVEGQDFMLHADHTYADHPWYKRLLAGRQRGLGTELRLFGVNPDEFESRARKAGTAVLQAATDKSHGWREVWVRDPDGYVWAVGSAIED
jgi:catechol 2,3-dioxygenase-like lactoylglutathione lyase family enzyme